MRNRGRGRRGGRLLESTSGGTADPRAIFGASLAAWYDASRQSPVADGTAVLPTDFSGRGRNTAQGTGSKQPLYKVNIQNGLPIFRFDGVDDSVQALFAFVAPCTKFIVAKLVSFNGLAHSYILDGGSAAQGAILAEINSSLGTSYSGNFLSIGVMGTGAFQVLGVVFNGASSRTYFNSNAAVSGDTGAGLAGGGVTLGANGLQTGQWAVVDIAEVILVEGAVQDAAASYTMSYLKNKWGTV